MMNLEEYTNFINKNSQNSTEHTFRTPLENLLNGLKLDSLIEIIHEAKKELNEDGTPDFKIIKSDNFYIDSQILCYRLIKCRVGLPTIYITS